MPAQRPPAKPAVAAARFWNKMEQSPVLGVFFATSFPGLTKNCLLGRRVIHGMPVFFGRTRLAHMPSTAIRRRPIMRANSYYLAAGRINASLTELVDFDPGHSLSPLLAAA